jgi:hypothetical protein
MRTAAATSHARTHVLLLIQDRVIRVITQVPETRGRSLESLEEDVEIGAIFIVRWSGPHRGGPHEMCAHLCCVV